MKYSFHFIKNILLFILILLTTASCSLVYRTLLGIDITPKWVSDGSILKQGNRRDIPEADHLMLDTVSFRRALIENFRNDVDAMILSRGDSTEYFFTRKILNDDLQPAQFRLFESTGTETFKLVNCYIDPPIPLNWNVDGCFDSFPPKIDIESLNVHQFDLDFILARAHFVDGSRVTLEELPKADYYGVIFWNSFFKRPSNRLISQVRKYIKRSGADVHLIYINNHSHELWYMLDAETKLKVKGAYEAAGELEEEISAEPKSD